MSLEDYVAIETGPVKMSDLPKGFWVASMCTADYCVPFPIPAFKDGECKAMRPLISNRPDGLITVLQNHDFAKLIGVKMVTSKRYTAVIDGVEAEIVVEKVCEHIKRLDGFNKEQDYVG